MGALERAEQQYNQLLKTQEREREERMNQYKLEVMREAEIFLRRLLGEEFILSKLTYYVGEAWYEMAEGDYTLTLVCKHHPNASGMFCCVIKINEMDIHCNNVVSSITDLGRIYQAERETYQWYRKNNEELEKLTKPEQETVWGYLKQLLGLQ